MFNPTGLGRTIFRERYALHEDETWTEACRRVARWAASCEARDKIAEVEEAFFHILSEGLFMPGGRIWYAAGRPFAQGLNCFVLPVSDSREGIGTLFHDTMVVSGTGGGIGVNFSSLRGRGAPIHGMGGSSTGAVSFMKAQDAIGEQIIAGGSRRTALMQCLNIDHPDVVEFIDTKLERNELNNANVSVVIPKHMHPEWFADQVQRGSGMQLRFGGKPTGKRINASRLWERIVENAHNSGEPGVLNGYLANQENNMHYRHDLVSTNPCGEIWLPEYGCCDLGALVLPRFVRESGEVEYALLAESVYWSVRFLDNVLSVTSYPLSGIREMAQGERRIGLGVMGLHSFLLRRGVRYSRSTSEVTDLFEVLRNNAYNSSIELAKEKGSFAYYDEALLQSEYAKRLPRDIRERIQRYGIRNCAILTIAPTGTTSMVQDVTAGIEPIFSPVYLRGRFVTGEVVGERNRDQTLVVSNDFGKYLWLAEGAYDVSPESHFDVQRAVQPFVDNAVSKTVNLPADYKVDQLSDLLLSVLHDVKGFTLYREGSRENEPLQHVPVDKAQELLESWKGDIEMEDGTTAIDPCITGTCDV